MIDVPVSSGDLIDRISILALKLERIHDPEKLTHIRTEYRLLTARCDAALAPSPELAALVQEIAAVNQQLWDLEDALRAMEKAEDFGAEFITKARAVYATNDERARIKRRIDTVTGSALSEQKSYL